MITLASSVDESREEDLMYANEYLDMPGIPQSDYAKGLRVRRLICRVCKLKFRTRQETQEHIRREHRRVQP
jgi:hypothetical protein